MIKVNEQVDWNKTIPTCKGNDDEGMRRAASTTGEAARDWLGFFSVLYIYPTIKH